MSKSHTSNSDRTVKENPFDELKPGGFHKWLGKSKDQPITDKDIEKGLKSDDPHVRKMAQFAKNAKKFKHPKKDDKKGKPAHEGLDQPFYLQW